MDELYFGRDEHKRTLRDYRMPVGYQYMQALNECLHDHPEVSLQRLLKMRDIEFAFDVERFWFCLTGVKKDIYRRVYGCDDREYLNIYEPLREALLEEAASSGWKADVFLTMLADEKQIAILMSPGEGADCGARELAERMGRVVQRGYEIKLFRGNRRYCSVTALSEQLHGVGGIREGYLQTRALNDLSFFRMEPGVLTAADVEKNRGRAGYSEVLRKCYDLAMAVDEGDCNQARSGLDELFLRFLRENLSMTLCRDAFSFLKNMIQIRRTASGLAEEPELEALCNVENYLKIEECVEALSPVVDDLCTAVREQGQHPRPVIHAIYYIKNHYAEEITLPDVARYVNVTPNYLSGIFRDNMGLSLRDYITETRVEAARKLLAGRGVKVAEAAEAVGFHDVKYFARVFKKLTGESPARYREKHA